MMAPPTSEHKPVRLDTPISHEDARFIQDQADQDGVPRDVVVRRAIGAYHILKMRTSEGKVFQMRDDKEGTVTDLAIT